MDIDSKAGRRRRNTNRNSPDLLERETLEVTNVALPLREEIRGNASHLSTIADEIAEELSSLSLEDFLDLPVPDGLEDHEYELNKKLREKVAKEEADRKQKKRLREMQNSPREATKTDASYLPIVADEIEEELSSLSLKEFLALPVPDGLEDDEIESINDLRELLAKEEEEKKKERINEVASSIQRYISQSPTKPQFRRKSEPVNYKVPLKCFPIPNCHSMTPEKPQNGDQKDKFGRN